MNKWKVVIRLVSLIIITYALFLIIGAVSLFIEFLKNQTILTVDYFLRTPLYVLLFVAGVFSLMFKRAGVTLLFCALAYDILYWFIPGLYQKVFQIVMEGHSSLGASLALLYLFCQRFLIPIILIIFFTRRQVRNCFDNK